MNAYMMPETSRALLAKSRAYTEPKRAERIARHARQRLIAEAFAQFERIGFGHTAAAELAEIYVKSEESNA